MERAKDVLKKADSMNRVDICEYLEPRTPMSVDNQPFTPRWNFSLQVKFREDERQDAAIHLRMLNKDLNQFFGTPILPSGELIDLVDFFQGYEWGDVALFINKKVLRDSDGFEALLKNFGSLSRTFDFFVNKAEWNDYKDIMTKEQKARAKEKEANRIRLQKEKEAEQQRILEELEANKGDPSSSWGYTNG